MGISAQPNRVFLNNRVIDGGRLDESIRHWQENHPYGTIIASAEKFHQELLEEYGGDCEGDSDI